MSLCPLPVPLCFPTCTSLLMYLCSPTAFHTIHFFPFLFCYWTLHFPFLFRVLFLLIILSNANLNSFSLSPLHCLPFPLLYVEFHLLLDYPSWCIIFASFPFSRLYNLVYDELRLSNLIIFSTPSESILCRKNPKAVTTCDNACKYRRSA